MDWPTRTLWSRILWFRLRLHYRRARWRRGHRSAFTGEPAWWSEFEQAFWLHVHSESPTPEGRPPKPGVQPPPQGDA